jgi:hypothetical protein
MCLVLQNNVRWVKILMNDYGARIPESRKDPLLSSIQRLMLACTLNDFSAFEFEYDEHFKILIGAQDQQFLLCNEVSIWTNLRKTLYLLVIVFSFRSFNGLVRMAVFELFAFCWMNTVCHMCTSCHCCGPLD